MQNPLPPRPIMSNDPDSLGLAAATAMDIDEASVSSGSDSDASSLASYIAPIQVRSGIPRLKLALYWHEWCWHLRTQPTSVLLR